MEPVNVIAMKVAAMVAPVVSRMVRPRSDTITIHPKPSPQMPPMKMPSARMPPDQNRGIWWVSNIRVG